MWIYSNALYNTLWGTLPDCFMVQFTIFFDVTSRIHRCPQNRMSDARPQHRELHALLFNVPQLFKGCETGPPAYSPYPRRLESLTICCCNYKGSTFYSVILRPWVLVRPESNSRPPASQPNAQQLTLLRKWNTKFKVRMSQYWSAWQCDILVLFIVQCTMVKSPTL